jgi:hypothetical protein
MASIPSDSQEWIGRESGIRADQFPNMSPAARRILQAYGQGPDAVTYKSDEDIKELLEANQRINRWAGTVENKSWGTAKPVESGTSLTRGGGIGRETGLVAAPVPQPSHYQPPEGTSKEMSAEQALEARQKSYYGNARRPAVSQPGATYGYASLSSGIKRNELPTGKPYGNPVQYPVLSTHRPPQYGVIPCSEGALAVSDSPSFGTTAPPKMPQRPQQQPQQTVSRATSNTSWSMPRPVEDITRDSQRQLIENFNKLAGR